MEWNLSRVAQLKNIALQHGYFVWLDNSNTLSIRSDFRKGVDEFLIKIKTRGKFIYYYEGK